MSNPIAPSPFPKQTQEFSVDPRPAPNKDGRKVINIALQGGGSHGAFTWGVLDRLLEEDARLKIEGISGTSAGAMNGAALVQGYMKGGAEGARQSLDQFWQGVGRLAMFELPQRSMYDQMTGNWNLDTSPFMIFANALQQMFSPYQTNPFNLNPLRDMIKGMIDAEAIRACEDIKLFITATNVETGRIKVFERKDLTIDVLMASACLPFTFQAVKIDDVPYWDGGYVGNPAIFPLIYKCDSVDVVVVQINPLIRKGIPDTATEIINRLNEITFNASFISEMRAIAFVQRLIQDGHLKDQKMAGLKCMNMHAIQAEDFMRSLGATSKFNAGLDFLLHLKEMGRQTTDTWLKANWDHIGKDSSIDINDYYL